LDVKRSPDDFALFGGKPLFESIRSTSNLVRPDFGQFLAYSRLFFDDNRYSGEGRAEQLLDARLAEFHGVRHCISLCSGFWGLVLGMKCLALPGRTEVVIPSLTYRRLADAVAWAGLTPHFCEVDPVRLCMTAETASPCINDNTALILGVHPLINCCDAEGLEALATKLGMPLLFDSVEAAYESVNGRKVGSFGLAECFSMHASKLLNAFEGGYVTTNDNALAHSLRSLRNCGPGVNGASAAPGMNARQNEIHAAMALAALDNVEEQVERNRRRYQRYQLGLADVPGLRLLQFDERLRPGYKNIVAELLDDWPMARELTLALLHKDNVLCRPYYYPPLHLKKAAYKTVWGDLSRTEALARRFLTLPCGYFVSEEDVGLVCDYFRALHTHGAALAQRAAKAS
jgi:dTDP-4-amino-4,6-dideoxygalactose transaminase